jgi:hypothetical protein
MGVKPYEKWYQRDIKPLVFGRLSSIISLKVRLEFSDRVSQLNRRTKTKEKRCELLE